MSDLDSELEAALALHLLDSSSDDEKEEDFYDAVYRMIARDALQVVENVHVVRNKDGSVRKVNRIDYSRSRKQVKSSNPWVDVYWLRLISDPTTQNPSTNNGKEFRRMFRTPYPVFEEIVRKCRSMTDVPEFNYESNAVRGTVTIPLELKILYVLRVLATGVLLIDGTELTNGYISKSEGYRFFKSFCALFREHFGPLYIKPLVDEGLSASLKEYAMLGLPGCIGSVDATFIPWDCIPNELQNLCKGDKGKGLLYETIVTHSKRVIGIQGSFYATIPDKSSVKYSKFLCDLKDKRMYRNVSYNCSWLF